MGRADEALRALRAFHFGRAVADAAAPPENQATPNDLVPALLSAFASPDAVRTDYPLLLEPDGSARPLADALEAASPGRVLADNLRGVERFTRDAIGTGTAPVNALRETGTKLAKSLRLTAEPTAELAADLDRVIAALPSDGELTGLGPETDMRLWHHAAGAVTRARRMSFAAELDTLRAKLRTRLDVEAAKDPSARAPKRLKAAIGGGVGRFINTSALSSALGTHRGAERMSDPRRGRVAASLEVLERDWEPPDAVVFEDVALDDAIAEFDTQAAALADVLRAVRVAKLELGEAYEPSRHDAWLAAFDWRSFEPEELALLPAVAAFVDGGRLAGDGLGALSRLLRSGRPVTVVARVQPAVDPGAETPFDGARLELSYLGVSHRQAAVHQTSVARPTHLMAAFQRCAATPCAALCVVSTGRAAGRATPRLGPWMHAGAALEGRAHPFFAYDPTAGETWAERLQFDGNPAPDADWPVYPHGEGELPFTFADYALLEPAYADHFRAAAASLDDSEVLVGVDAWLELDADAAAQKLPYILGADSDGRTHKLVISRRLAWACRDRLSFWRTLQELAGVRNAHVVAAVAKVRAELEAAAAEERAASEAAHREEIERVQRETASEAMAGLAAALTDFEGAWTPGPAASAPAPAPAAEAAAPASEPEAAPAPKPEPVAEEPDEAWVDSAMCTTCNDCIDVNSLLFVYDGNKQARISDPKAGTFEQLVRAAEACPAKCIHPGAPLDPNEPNLAELVARAAPFQ